MHTIFKVVQKPFQVCELQIGLDQTFFETSECDIGVGRRSGSCSGLGLGLGLGFARTPHIAYIMRQLILIIRIIRIIRIGGPAHMQYIM